MTDPRIKLLAKNLINYSVKARKGDKVLIEAFDTDDALVSALVQQAAAVGAYPFVELRSNAVMREIMLNASEEYCTALAKHDRARMEDMQCYIGIRGALNSYETGDVPSDKQNAYNTFYSHAVHHDVRVEKTRWVVLRYPTPSFAQLCAMSTSAFEDFYFDVCTLDYNKMAKAMDGIKALMEKTDRVHIVGKDTDLRFSIKGIGAVKCCGLRNIPDGEIYTAPVKDSVEGVITYNAPSIKSGMKFDNVRLEFSKGKIVDASAATFNDKINAIFDVDAGARYVGEFALGVNPYITRPVGDILFDEKISGSIHFTPGSCYSEANNGNNSALHWDLVHIQTSEYGGGRIYFDDVLIRENGIFVLDELKCLNPENLK